MFGTREAFRYGACAACGLVWLLDVPVDLAPYYPPDYYSFAPIRPVRGVRAAARGLRRWAEMGHSTPVKQGVARRLSGPGPLAWLPWMRRTGATRDTTILDVGSGRGALLHALRTYGFRHLVGADPYLDADVTLPGGTLVRKARLDELGGQFDLVMCHHALEHMPEPALRLREMAARMTDDGWLLVRIPVSDSWAWRHYGVDWVHLDAPRHLFLHTRASIERLAGRAGLRIVAQEWDSTAFSLWGSEQYRRDVPLRDPRSRYPLPSPDLFAPEEVAVMDARARALNAAGEGDTAVFYLRRA